MTINDRPAPSVETSLKFMAWNHKGIDEKFAALTNSMNAISGSLASIDKSLKSLLAKFWEKCKSPEIIDDNLPF